MGRWLKKLEHTPKSAPTKLTEVSCVSFVGDTSEHIQENNAKKIDLFDFVSVACVDFQVNSQLVIDRLLSVEDDQDIINGHIPVETLKLHIKIWWEIGMPYYSGK
ncbi:MAG: hypothetical protein Q8R83_08645 [Legionellaceae bacterium]|nr:hypothetical protein [Legionellaceae bacterium]